MKTLAYFTCTYTHEYSKSTISFVIPFNKITYLKAIKDYSVSGEPREGYYVQFAAEEMYVTLPKEVFEDLEKAYIAWLIAQ